MNEFMTTSFWHTDAVGGRPHHQPPMSVLHQVGAAIPSAANIGGYGSPLSRGRRVERVARYLFCIALRSTKVLPPFILWASGASLIWITTASASTPRFVTSALVMSRIMPAFCSSVRPAAMLMVISGILVLPFLLLRYGHAFNPRSEERTSCTDVIIRES